MKLGKWIILYFPIILLVACEKRSKPWEDSLQGNTGKINLITQDSSQQNFGDYINSKETSSETNKYPRKSGKITNPKFPLKYVFGIWATDLNGPHADFKLDSNSWYIVDSERDGNLPYRLNYDSLIIFSDGLKIRYRILKADLDSLILENEALIVRNVRWKN